MKRCTFSAKVKDLLTAENVLGKYRTRAGRDCIVLGFDGIKGNGEVRTIRRRRAGVGRVGGTDRRNQKPLPSGGGLGLLNALRLQQQERFFARFQIGAINSVHHALHGILLLTLPLPPLTQV